VGPGGGSGTSLLLRPLLGAALSALLLAPAAWAQGKPQSRGVRVHYEYASGCGKDGPPECPWRAGQKSLIVDTDPGLGLSFTDIDDMLACHYLVTAGVNVKALTITHGNTDTRRAYAVASFIGGDWGMDIHWGAPGAEQDGPKASKALTRHKGGVLALGAMTNLAYALLASPQWDSLVVLGGSLPAGPNIRFLRTRELNFAVDEWAAGEVLSRAPAAINRTGGRRPVLIPMEAMRGQLYFQEDEVRLLPSWLQGPAKSWLSTQRWLAWTPGFVPWDVIGAMVLTHPHLFTLRRGAVSLLPGRSPLQSGYVAYDFKGGDEWDVVTAIDAAGLRAAYRALYGLAAAKREARAAGRPPPTDFKGEEYEFQEINVEL